jgi:beta-glucanase (GH16 family)
MRHRLDLLEPRRLFAAGAQPLGAGTNGIPNNYNASFHDDFEGTTLDSSKWFVREGMRWNTERTADSRPNVTSRDSVSVANGDLKLTVFSTATAHNTGWLQTKRRDTDGVIQNDVNDTRFEQSFGYWESRIKFSNGAPGAWQAFWVHSYQMEGPAGAASVIGNEMDVVESGKWGGWTGDNSIKSTVHWNGYNTPSNRGYEYVLPNGNVADYHVYGLKWTNSSISFYVDGIKTGEYNDPAMISTIRQGIILSNEVSSRAWWTGIIPAQGYGTPETSTTYMLVDYVKVWADPSAPPPRTPVPDEDPTPNPTPDPTVRSSIRGVAYLDQARNGVMDRLDRGLHGRTVFVDTNDDGFLSIDEPRGVTDTAGTYQISNLPPGTYKLRQVLPPNWIQTAPLPSPSLTITLSTTAVTNANFGSYTNLSSTPQPAAPGTGVSRPVDVSNRLTLIRRKPLADLFSAV